MTIGKPKARKIKPSELSIYYSEKKVKIDPEWIRRMGPVICYEGGNGKAGLAYYNDQNKLVTCIMPNARMMTSGQSVNRNAGSVMNLPFAEFQGTKWAYSDAIFNVPDARIDAFQGSAERYGSAEHIFSLLVMMAENDLPDGAYKLLVTVPPGFHEEVEQRVIARFQAGDPLLVNKRQESSGVWQIALSKDGIKRMYSFPVVKVIMEAADGGYAAFRYDLDGNVTNLTGADGQDMLGGTLRLFDLGFVTNDMPTLIDGLLITDRIKSTSDSNGGIMSNLAIPLINGVVDQLPYAGTWLTPAHADYWLRRYVSGYISVDGTEIPRCTEASGTIFLSGKAIKMKRFIDDLSRKYAETYLWPKIANAGAVDAFLLIGGGWLYTIDYILRWHQESNISTRLVTLKDAPHLKGFSLVDLNLIGMISVARLIDWTK
jgi:hypothetical protein